MRQPISWLLLGLFTIGLPLTVLAQGNIAGQVMSERVPLTGAQVNIFDPINAVIVATSTADSRGLYDSGPLPAGNYKVRFSDDKSFPAYFGAGSTKDGDYFDLGTLVEVQTGSTTVVNMDLAPQPPIVILPCYSSGFVGYVTDDTSGTPIDGIHVSAVNAANAMPFASADTANGGTYVITPPKDPMSCITVKVRFSDPTAIYLPEYWEGKISSHQDVFALGAPIVLGENTRPTASTSLVKLTPAGAINNLVGEIVSTSLPQVTKDNMTVRLGRAKDLVSDNNPNNDAAACGVLKSLANEINAKQNSGELSGSEAAVLIQFIDTARTTIGCR
jgi:hypothetical protein